MYLQSELSPVELECGRVHHAATYSFLKPASMQDCADQGSCQANINLHNMLRQVKEDRRCIFKASSDLLSLNAEDFIMQQPTPSQTRAVPSQHQPTQHAASGERRPEMHLQSELRPVELECGRVHHAATYSVLKHASMQDCAEQGPCQANINLHNMLRQVKEDRRCIFKASSDLLSLNAEEFIMQPPAPPSSMSACKVATNTGRAKPTSTYTTCCVR